MKQRTPRRKQFDAEAFKAALGVERLRHALQHEFHRTHPHSPQTCLDCRDAAECLRQLP